jgi:ubiquinone/menaquinone biosynthesis C-methylase UbiE
MTNFSALNSFYENEGKEDVRLSQESVQYIEYITAKKYLEKYIPKNCKILDNCAGSGIYAFMLNESGHTVTAGDIVPYNVKQMQDKDGENNAKLKKIYLGDSRDLSAFESESFDVVLCMGALYHLSEEEDRIKALKESMRVLKKGGLLFASFMNRYAVILNNLNSNLNVKEMLEFKNSGIEGIFYASSISEAERLMASCGIKKKCHIALDGMTLFLFATAQALKQADFENWKTLHLAMCEDESVLYQSYHTLFIGEKNTMG